MATSRPITQTMIARLAGVSAATVSRALSGDPRISSEVTAAVKRLAREHDYRPSAAARSFVTRRTNTMGLVVIDRTIATSIYGALVESVAQALGEAGQKLQFASWDSPQRRADELHPIFRDDGLDGVILAGSVPEWLLRKLVGWNMPVALLGTQAGVPGVNQVTGDVDACARLAAGHLLELGHRDIGILIGPRERDIHRRYYESFCEVCVRGGISAKALERATIECRTPDVVDEVRLLLERSPKTTAILSDTDYVAWQAMQVLRATGRRVPEDISVVGEGGWYANGLIPVDLTTVDVQVDAMGRAAARLLVDHANDSSLPVQRVVIEPKLRLGQTARKLQL